MRSSSINRTGNVRLVWIVLAIVLVAAVVSGVALFMMLKKKPYVAVYLVTGDIYYGKMSYSPKFTLDDAIFLQRGQDGNLGLQKLSDAFWKPKGPMYIEKDQIVFWSKLDPSSPVINAIEGLPLPAEMQAQQQPTQAPAEQPGTVPATNETP